MGGEILREGGEGNTVSVYETVLQMRRCRRHMVQKCVQYIFLYECLRDFLTGERSSYEDTKDMEDMEDTKNMEDMEDTKDMEDKEHMEDMEDKEDPSLAPTVIVDIERCSVEYRPNPSS